MFKVSATVLSLSLAVAGLIWAPAQAADCALPPDVPLKHEGRTPVFKNPCGQLFQAGYRLEGTTLHFPGGGTHAIRDVSEDEAERVLREAYGLVGPRDRLVRTVWPD
jgi:hypothetical protein